MTGFKLTDAIICGGVNEKSFVRGHKLYRSGAISKATFDIKDQFRRRPALMAKLKGL